MLKFKSKYRYLIDAGHGGLDEKGNYVTKGKKMYEFTDVKDPREKDGKKPLIIHEGVVNRLIAARLIALMDEGEIDSNIIFAPVEDTPLKHRLAIASNFAKNEATREERHSSRQCILLSIHNNASQNKIKGKAQKPGGCEIWTSKGEDVSDLVADFFAQEYKKKWNKKYGPFRSYTGNKGTEDKEADFTMLGSNMPSVLVECGFYDNKVDALRMIDPEWIEDMAKWLFNSIKKIEASEESYRWIS